MAPPTCPSCNVELMALKSKALREAWADDEGLKWAVRVSDGLAWWARCKDCHLQAWPLDQKARG